MPADLSALEATAAEAKAAYDLARKDRERAERLLAARAIPSKRVDEAQAAEITAEARFKSAQARLAQHEVTRNAEADVSGDSAFVVRAPISGVVSQSLATAGASVESGQHLFTVVAVDTVYVVANVPESEAPRLKHVTGAEMEIPGINEPLPLRRLVSIGKVVDPASRTLGIVYELANNGHIVAVGQSAFLRLFNSERTTAAAVPESALVDDAGRPVVFVQRAGEAFARRPVKLGNREAGRVQILEGVKPGERVVTRGAYLIRLSAMSSQIPAHGHVH
jgi:RND family efflux transporter MFP subunit